MHWHQRSNEDIFNELGTSPQGLFSEEAAKRLSESGPNELKESEKKTALMMFLDQFRDFMIMILIGAAVISGVIGELSDTIAIVVIVILNAVIGFVQEYRAEKAIAALKQMAAPTAVVMRNSAPSSISAKELVPGDLVILEAGMIVPADIRLVETAQLRIEEAVLTGESVPVEKQTGSLSDGGLPLGDRLNMVYKGTTISYGRGTGIVVETGMDTEIGRIAKMLQEEDEVKTPLQKRLAGFGKRIAVAVLVICAVVFIIGVLRGEPPVLMMLTAISLAVAAIPEALPAVVTISLALGARKMVRQNALIRKLPAVETLGSVTYICSDKTGTLTQNRMNVEEVFVDGKVIRSSSFSVKEKDAVSEIPETHSLLFTAFALNNDARDDAAGKVLGDPTEIALYSIARDNGFLKSEMEKKFPRVDEIPFDSERKSMTTIHAAGDRGQKNGKIDDAQFISFTKGAPDVLIDSIDAVLTSTGIRQVDRNEILKVNERMTAEGLRVLVIAMRKWHARPDCLSHGEIESGLILLGLAGIMDPPREEAAEAVRMCRSAGIIPVMITGDHPITARTIAQKLGMIEAGSRTIITGRELEKLPPEEFGERVEKIRVYARVAPEQKLKIVKALQDKGHFAAMTGDGVNDAPALKRADIGIAMGISGTDVSKEASHMILLDDNFATIVKAVKEGRKIYDNIRKIIKYLLSSNAAEVLTIFLAPFFGLPIPLLPIHILWINLMTDGLPALALSVEPAEGEVMKRPPRHPKESIFARGLGFYCIWVGLLMAGVTIFAQAWSIKTGHAHWQTMAFTVLCLSQFGNVLAIRSERESLFTIGFLSNKPLIGAIVFSFIAQMATIYVPVLNDIFKTQPLTFPELLFTLALSSVIFFAVEIEKLLVRIGWLKYYSY
jgi:Ca2+-transporting ATPase